MKRLPLDPRFGILLLGLLLLLAIMVRNPSSTSIVAALGSSGAAIFAAYSAYQSAAERRRLEREHRYLRTPIVQIFPSYNFNEHLLNLDIRVTSTGVLNLALVSYRQHGEIKEVLIQGGTADSPTHSMIYLSGITPPDAGVLGPTLRAEGVTHFYVSCYEQVSNGHWLWGQRGDTGVEFFYYGSRYSMSYVGPAPDPLPTVPPSPFKADAPEKC